MKNITVDRFASQYGETLEHYMRYITTRDNQDHYKRSTRQNILLCYDMFGGEKRLTRLLPKCGKTLRTILDEISK